MKRALMVGVPERDTSGRLERVLGVDAMVELLDDLGGWSVKVLSGRDATRRAVLHELEAMVAECRPDDTCLFYFFGHGGVVRFSDLRGELGRRAVFYLATLRPPGSSERVGVLDVELSAALARLDRTCGNVSAIIDCCHAASMVRGDPIPTALAPPWARTLDDHGGGRDHLLAAQSHPRIVRLFGSSSMRTAYATKHPDGLFGLMTRCFVEVVREAGLRCDRLTWDAVAHRAREWASRQRGTEEQRVVLAGPRNRLVFSARAVPVPQSAAFVPAREEGRGWIRAGLIQGVRRGDRWMINELELDDALEPRACAEARIEEVGLDCAEVVLSTPGVRPALGAMATMHALDRRLPVVVDGVSDVAEALRTSGLLRAVPPGSPEVIAMVRHAQGRARGQGLIDIVDDEGRALWLDTTLDGGGLQRVIELLEDRARARVFERALGGGAGSAMCDTELTWSWGVLGPEGETRPWLSHGSTRGPRRIRPGDRLWVEVRHCGSTPRNWFVSVVDVDLEGRLSLLNTNEPEGLEVISGETVYVGRRGHRRRQGLVCGWPRRVPADGPRRERLVLLASRRPFSLGHLVRVPAPDDPTAFAAQGLGLGVRSLVRGESSLPFVVSTDWAWAEIRFEVDPRAAVG